MVDDPTNLVSLSGLVVFIAFSWATSYKPREVRWGPVLSGGKFPFFDASWSSLLLLGLEFKLCCFLLLSLSRHQSSMGNSQ